EGQEPSEPSLLGARRALLHQLVRERARAHSEVYPLSYEQSAIWYLQQREPTTTAFHAAYGGRILSTLSPDQLRDALQALSNRHSQLRTTFHWRNGACVQETLGYQDIELDQFDARRWTDEELFASVQRQFEQPFNLEIGPVLRVQLFTRAVDHH